MARHALLIATTQHSDAVFSRAIAPEAEVRAFAGALRSPNIGGFDSVAELVNRPSDVVREEIEGFFQGRAEDDLLVLYLSGHVVVNARGLQLVTATTKRDRLAATAIPADFVRDLMDGCRSRQQVVVLDCAFSGTSDRPEGAGVGGSAGTAAAFEGNGLGRVVLAATDAIAFVFGAEDPTVDPSSRFTHILVEGLQSGAADLNRDGQIKINELFEFACQQLVKALAKQTPGKWNYWQPSDLVIAKNPRPVPRPDLLSPKLLAALESSERWEVEGAVRELVRLSTDPNPGLALAAKEKLDTLVRTVSERPPPVVVASPLGVGSSPPRAPTPALDSSPRPSAVSPAAPVAKPVAVALPVPPMLDAAPTAAAPAKSAAKSYASLRPKSVRPQSSEPGPAEAAVPVPPPDFLAPAAAAPAVTPVKEEALDPEVSVEPEPAQVAAPLGPDSGGGADADLLALLRRETAEEPSASEPSPLVAELPSAPRAKAVPASLAGSFAGLGQLAWIRQKSRLWLAGAAGLVVIGLATYLIVRKGSLNIEVRPNGKWTLGEISVLVDGDKRCSRSPCRVDGLSAGGHEVAVTATGYRRESVPVAVSRGAVNAVPITLELEGPTGIAVGDLGSDVQLVVDGQSRGNVPQELTRLAPGEHQIVIEGGERYQSFKTRVTVEAGKMTSLAPKLKVKKGRVTVQLGQNADEAKVELACGAERRPAPKQAFEVAAEQSCKVVATKDGYLPFDQAIQFNDGEAERLIKVDLVEDPKAQHASATVRADDRTAQLPERQNTIQRPRLNPDAK